MRRRLAVELERAGVSAAGFSALVVLTTAGGSLELRTLRRRFGWSKANATEVTETLEARGFVQRHRLPEDRRAVVVLPHPPGPRARGPALPGARRAGQRGVRRPGRRREALAGRDLPQASRIGPPRPHGRSASPIGDRASTGPCNQYRPKWATQIVACSPLHQPVERPTPIQRHSPDRITSRCSDELIQRRTVLRASALRPQCISRFSPGPLEAAGHGDPGGVPEQVAASSASGRSGSWTRCRLGERFSGPRPCHRRISIYLSHHCPLGRGLQRARLRVRATARAGCSRPCVGCGAIEPLFPLACGVS